MRGKIIYMNGSLIGMAAFGALLGACGSPQSAAPEQAAAPAPQVAAAVPETAPSALATETTAPPAAPAAFASSEPQLANMKVAQVVSGKIGVPVDLRYQIDGDAMVGQPVTVHLAAVPRVAGTNLAVSIKQEPGIEFAKATLNAEKVSAATAYRQQVRLTRLASGPQALRVLVTMDFPIGTGFTYFNVPLSGGSSNSKENTP